MFLKRVVFHSIRGVGRLFSRKHIWLVSDRERSAGDNGEAFFRYLQDKPVNSVFAISKDSPDYARMKEIGKVVDYGSPMYKILLCISDCHISSQLIHMESHSETPQIFLQHGISEKSIVKMLEQVCHKNFYFLCASRQESLNRCRDEYSISGDHIWNLGFPRFDLLENDVQKLVVIVFTWRAELAGSTEEEFKKSYYYSELSRIMADEKLLDELAKRGYKLCIKIHPEMERFKDLLPVSDKCSIYTKSYRELYKEAAILVTDYSSCVYDFAYLGKAVIYYQFDDGRYFKNNPYIDMSGFSYKEDGVGPVATSYETFVSELEKCIDNGCTMGAEYLNRMKEFFFYHDKNNCERVYKKILETI
jgi:CDP-glycerol glycerophosphotransferase (TagB/SpsB family)